MVSRWYARSMMARACQGLRRRPALMLTADGEALNASELLQNKYQKNTCLFCFRTCIFFVFVSEFIRGSKVESSLEHHNNSKPTND
jgi:hypothetical protein